MNDNEKQMCALHGKTVVIRFHGYTMTRTVIATELHKRGKMQLSVLASLNRGINVDGWDLDQVSLPLPIAPNGGEGCILGFNADGGEIKAQAIAYEVA